MLSWEEMSPLEQAQCQYWDMYKDAMVVALVVLTPVRGR